MTVPTKRYITKEPVVATKAPHDLRKPAAVAGLAASATAVAIILAFGSSGDAVLSAAAQDEPASSTPVVPPIPVVPVLPQENAVPVLPQVEPLPTGSAAPVVPTLAASGIPSVALQAYQRAAAALATADPGCGLSWSVLAAIGRVETNHGRFGGSALRADGSTTLPIRGPRLTGNPFALVLDTDHGALDGDTVYDRAIGPMQFLPATWRSLNADGNLDGRSDPDNIFDAALAAGLYLCSGPGDLRDDAQLRAAVLRYNHSDEYANTVLALAKSYLSGFVTVPNGPVTSVPPGTVATVPGAGAAASAAQPSYALEQGTAAGANTGTAGVTTGSGSGSVSGGTTSVPAAPAAPATSAGAATTAPAAPPATTAPPAPAAPATTTSNPPLLSLGLPPLGLTITVP